MRKPASIKSSLQKTAGILQLFPRLSIEGLCLKQFISFYPNGVLQNFLQIYQCSYNLLHLMMEDFEQPDFFISCFIPNYVSLPTLQHAFIYV